MSRGLGRLQRALIDLIRKHGKPMTFEKIQAQICVDVRAYPGTPRRMPLEGSVRRALHSLVDVGCLITIGGGGPSDPYRYFLHPMFFALIADREEWEAVVAALDAAPGGREAANRATAKFLKT
jgi:hypothetical protein